MSRYFRLIPLVALVFPVVGCGTSDMPTVPPPPKEGTVKAAPASPGVLPPAARKKLQDGRTRKTDTAPAS